VDKELTIVSRGYREKRRMPTYGVPEMLVRFLLVVNVDQLARKLSPRRDLPCKLCSTVDTKDIHLCLPYDQTDRNFPTVSRVLVLYDLHLVGHSGPNSDRIDYWDITEHPM
jgi:hypothetical protein